jgi:hypothetical protein
MAFRQATDWDRVRSRRVVPECHRGISGVNAQVLDVASAVEGLLGQKGFCSDSSFGVALLSAVTPETKEQ